MFLYYLYYVGPLYGLVVPIFFFDKVYVSYVIYFFNSLNVF